MSGIDGVTRYRRPRHRNLHRSTRSRKLNRFLAERVTALTGTGTGTVVTVDFANNQFGAVGHGFQNGAGPFAFTAGTTLPTGLFAENSYWIIRIDDDNFSVSSSPRAAINNEVVEIGDAGVGTITITPAAEDNIDIFLLIQKGEVKPEVVFNATDIDSLIP
jgi:hypothetical protein